MHSHILDTRDSNHARLFHVFLWIFCLSSLALNDMEHTLKMKYTILYHNKLT